MKYYTDTVQNYTNRRINARRDEHKTAVRIGENISPLRQIENMAHNKRLRYKNNSRIQISHKAGQRNSEDGEGTGLF